MDALYDLRHDPEEVINLLRSPYVKRPLSQELTTYYPLPTYYLLLTYVRRPLSQELTTYYPLPTYYLLLTYVRRPLS